MVLDGRERVGEVALDGRTERAVGTLQVVDGVHNYGERAPAPPPTRTVPDEETVTEYP